ncbi:MAG: hypothetical protein SPE43_10455, partial [Ruminococcus sp.]|nr:hypothetical protein [Ruminococcus sp.]
SFRPLLKKGSYLYTEASYYKSDVHLYLKDMLPEFVCLAKSEVYVYLMHLDVEDEILRLIKGTHIKLAVLYD